MDETKVQNTGIMGEKYRILIVDDEEPVVRALQRALRKEPYCIITVNTGTSALAALAEQPIQLVLVDFRMPDMNGVELVEKIREKYPEVIRIVLSGYSESWAVIDAINRGSIYKFLTKPWDDEALKLTLKRALEFYELEQKNRKLTAHLQALNQQLQEVNTALEQKVQDRTRALALAGENREKTLTGIVLAMSMLMDIHNSGLVGHGQRTAKYSRLLAMELTSSLNLADLERAAFLHDIGKIYVEDMDRQRLQTAGAGPAARRGHAEAGYQILNQIPGFEPIARIVRHHHESFDGSGFPDGLKGEMIPLPSRIITIADAFDRLLFPCHNVLEPVKEDLLERFNTLCSLRLDPWLANIFREKVYPQLDIAGEAITVPMTKLLPGMLVLENIYDSAKQIICPAMTLLDSEKITMIRQRNDELDYLRSIKVKLGSLRPESER